MSTQQKKKRRILQPLITVLVMAVIITSVSVVLAAPEDFVSFADNNLKQALFDVGADVNFDGEISESEMAALTGTFSCAWRGITDLGGIEYLTGISELDISGNALEDISVLAQLPALSHINVSSNNLSLADGSEDKLIIDALIAAGKAVTYAPQKGATANPDPIFLCTDDTYGLAEFIAPADAAAQAVTWASGNTGVATVSAEGIVTAHAVGSAAITVTTLDGSYVAWVNVRVVEGSLTSSIYDISGGVLRFAAAGTSAAQLCANMSNETGMLGVFDGDIEYTGSAVATGMTVRLTIGGTVRDEAEILVLGDVNGDGQINISDYTLTRLDILNLQPLAGSGLVASDLDGDGQISISDYTLLRLHILGIQPIDGHASPPPEDPNPQIVNFLTIAHAQLGKPYVYGDEGPDSFDCSGFAHYCMTSAGYSIHRTSADSYSRKDFWTYVEKADLQPGDLMFFFSDDPNDGDRIGHVGIFLGDGEYIHASSSRGQVVISSFRGWSDTMFSHGRRVFE